MAGNIKGITIEIGGNAQPLEKALKNVNKASRDATAEIRQIDKALKFDTGNVSLLGQKQEVLQKQIAATREKLETLRSAQSQVEAQFKSGDMGAEQYRAFQREVEITQNVLKRYESNLENVNNALNSNGQAVNDNKEQLKALQNEQAQLASEAEKIVSSFKLQESALGSNADEAEKYALSQKKIASQTEIVERQIENLKQQLNLAKSEYGENSVEANKLEKELNETATAFNKLQDEMRQTGAASEQAQGGLAETNRLLKADVMMQASDSLANVSQKLFDIGNSALEAFRKVDEGMDIIVQKTGATGQALEEMTGIAENIATTMPTSWEQVGNAVGEVNTQFKLTGDALKTTSEDMIKFAEISGTDISTATISSKQALEAYGLSVDWLSDVLDSTTYVSQQTGVATSDLMKKAIDGAPQIKALGLEFDEAVTLIGKFEQSGVDSSQALSSMTKATVNFAKEGKTLRDGLSETIDKIKNSTSETDALRIATEVFGSKSAPDMVDAIKRGAFSFDELAKTAENSAGSVSTTFESMLDPIDRFQIASNKMDLAMADVGNSIAETFAPLSEFFANIATDVANFFNQLPAPIKQGIILFGGLVAVVGVLAPIIAGLSAIMPVIVAGFGAFVGAVGPIAGIIAGVVAAITLLVIGIKTLWDNNEGFRTAVTEIWNNIQSAISTAVQTVSDFIMQIFGGVVQWWNENQQLIQQTVDTVWNAISSVIQSVLTTLQPMIEAAWTNIQTVITTVWDVIKIVVETAINNVLSIIKAVMQMINGDWSGAWETIKAMYENTWNAMVNIVTTVLDGISSIISNTWNAIQSTIGNIINAISSNIQSVWNTIQSTISGVMNGISGTVSSIWDGIKNTISSAIDGAKNAVGNAINAIKGFFNFQFRWPHIPLPHFSISGSMNPLDWFTQGLPKIGVQWYAKGGIMTKPTIFGQNGNNLMVGGEAGNEAILPLNKQTLGMIGQAIAETMNGASGGTNITVNISDVVVREEADIDKIANVVASKIAYELKRKQELLGGTA